jgi:hypothetical protein
MMMIKVFIDPVVIILGCTDQENDILLEYNLVNQRDNSLMTIKYLVIFSKQ